MLELPPSLADAGLAPLSGAKPTPAPTAPRDVQDMFRSATDLPVAVTDPPPYYEFTADPPSISALDLSVTTFCCSHHEHTLLLSVSPRTAALFTCTYLLLVQYTNMLIVIKYNEQFDAGQARML